MHHAISRNALMRLPFQHNPMAQYKVSTPAASKKFQTCAAQSETELNTTHSTSILPPSYKNI